MILTSKDTTSIYLNLRMMRLLDIYIYVTLYLFTRYAHIYAYVTFISIYIAGM